MEPEDLAKFLEGLLHFFANKERRYGSLNAQTTFVEAFRLGVETLSHVHRMYNGEKSHPAAALCEPLLIGDQQQVEQTLHKIAQTAVEKEFVEFCEALADYGAAVSGPAKRRRVGTLLFMLGRARAQAESGGGIVSPFPPQPAGSAPQPGSAPQHFSERLAFTGGSTAVNKDEVIFRRYMEMGPREGAAAIEADMGRMQREHATHFFRTFIAYAVTLRNDEKLKTAFALSNALYCVYRERFATERLSLQQPERRS